MKYTKLQKAIKKYCYKADYTSVDNKKFIIDWSGCYNSKQDAITSLIEKHFNITDFKSVPRLNVYYYSR